MDFIKRILRNLKNSENVYLKSLNKPIIKKAVLLEAGQGKNINGNMFAMLKEIEQNAKWSNLLPYFVVTKETEQKARERFEFYGFKRVTTVIRDSKKYQRILATAKYLMTDNSFPPYFFKREEQVYLNTWHGTPLKHLGRADIRNSISLANVQKNYFSSDYILFPNVHTRDVFMKDYMLENLYAGKIILADYPRNTVLFKEEAGEKLKKELNLNNKQLIAYMPTWRGTGRVAESKEQVQVVEKYLKEIDDKLTEEQFLFVNLHFLISENINFESFRHIRPFPGEYETYEFLNICDVLITDYSSVFFDFAATGKKIILFTYDYEEYSSDKGMYLDITEFPFPMVLDTNSLIKEINCKNYKNMDDFKEKFCAYRNNNTSESLLELLIHMNNQELNIEEICNHKEDVDIYHVGTLTDDIGQALVLEKIKELDYKKNNIVLTFEGGINYKKGLFLQNLPKEINFVALVNRNERTLWQKIYTVLHLRYGLFKKKALWFYNRENIRLFYGWEPKNVNMFLFRNPKLVYIYQAFHKSNTIYHKMPYRIMGLRMFKKYYKKLELFACTHFNKTIKYEENYGKEIINKYQRYTSLIKCKIKFPAYKKVENNVKVTFGLNIKAFIDIDMNKIRILVHNKYYYPKFIANDMKAHSNRPYNCRCFFCIPISDINNAEAQNPIVFEYISQDGIKEIIPLRTSRRYRKFFGINTKLFFIKDKRLTFFFRELRSTLTMTVRGKNVTDSPREKVKIVLAFLLSKIALGKKPIILYEKESSRYEESASVVYEQLIDKGYKNAYFILDKNYPHKNVIANKYLNNVVNKYSLKHYTTFFRAKTFIGSEAQVHAFELRPISKLVNRRLTRGKQDYVFLQHGVMYMISLDAERRTFFKNKSIKGKYRVVTSSELEANHFINLGGYLSDNIYLCGLPKFDKNVWNKKADKIVIMITWRPWEYIDGINNFKNTKYFKMIEKMCSAIPKEYKQKLIVLPHPLIADEMRNIDDPFVKYIVKDIRYDDILKETKLLITDYSSISYDAFYRGSNIIFYWEEKESCLKEYGENAKLMLTQDLAFGDTCYNVEQLKKAIKVNYCFDQKENYIRNYRKIVKYHDGKNTERLIEMMEEDAIL